MKAILKNESVISASQFTKEHLDHIFRLAREIEESPSKFRKVLKGKTISIVFYEPSTRTSSSFISACNKLGATTIPITQGIEFSSVSKGETLEDTIKTLECYSDLIVLRHPDLDSAQIASSIASVPIINAGSGPGEHPTQALLDLYTIINEVDATKTLNIALVGDLRYGRTVHSLVKLLPISGLTYKLSLVSPDLKMPESIIQEMKNNGVKYAETTVLNFSEPDVFYITRIQKERFLSAEEYENVKNAYIITSDDLRKMKETAIILHPFPRVNEIDRSVDVDKRAKYFKQIQNGLYVRMALLCHIIG